MRVAFTGSPAEPLRRALAELAARGANCRECADGGGVAAAAHENVLLLLPAGGHGVSIAALRLDPDRAGALIAVYGHDPTAALADLAAGADAWLDDTEDPAWLTARLLSLNRFVSERAGSAQDSRTGLPSERVFRERLGDEFRRAERYRRSLALLVAEVAGAEKAPARGKDPLRLAAALIAGTVREVDVTGRLREARIAVLMPESDATAGLALATRLRDALEKGSRPRLPGTRFGVAAFPARGIELPDQLLGRCLEALAQARSAEPGSARAFGDAKVVWSRVAPDPDAC